MIFQPINVICGFPGVGKSTLFRETNGVLPDGRTLLDSDSSTFDKSQFPQNYIAYIQQKIADNCVILCSTHASVRYALTVAKIPYAVIYPSLTAKEDYMARYKERGSLEAFYQLMNREWDNFVTQCRDDGNANLRVEMPSYCYLHLKDIEAILTFQPKTLP